MSYKYTKTYKIFQRIKNKIFTMINDKIAVDQLMFILEDVELRTAPIRINVMKSVPKRRVTIFLSEINFNYFFGGYIGMFNFAKLFYQNGYDVRIVTTNNNEINLPLWKEKIKKYKGLEDFFLKCKIENVYDRSNTYDFFQNEIIVATSWWTANITEQVRKEISAENFIYFIQDFEPLFYPQGTSYALALESYNFPHFAVFSTDILMDFFKKKQIGVFEKSSNTNAIYFKNAITELQPSNNMQKRKKKKFLFYFRPEEHATRNMFELGYLALKKAISNNVFEDWEFYGIGSLLPKNSQIPLCSNKFLKIIPKMNLQDYQKKLPEFDVGLSLMLSPHTSLVPTEMCTAGMNVVTNSFENKTKEAMKAISDNFYVAKPTVNSLAEAISDAVADVNNFEKRISGAKVNWPTDWNDTFDDNFKKKLFSFGK